MADIINENARKGSGGRNRGRRISNRRGKRVPTRRATLRNPGMGGTPPSPYRKRAHKRKRKIRARRNGY